MATAKTTPQFIEGDHGVNEAEAARILGVSVALVRLWRKNRGEGPRYRKVGRRVIYMVSDVFNYVYSRPSGGAKVA